jgi:hypothetical protein
MVGIALPFVHSAAWPLSRICPKVVKRRAAAKLTSRCKKTSGRPQRKRERNINVLGICKIRYYVIEVIIVLCHFFYLHGEHLFGIHKISFSYDISYKNLGQRVRYVINAKKNIHLG